MKQGTYNAFSFFYQCLFFGIIMVVLVMSRIYVSTEYKSLFNTNPMIAIAVFLGAVYFMLQNKGLSERLVFMLMGSLLYIILINLQLIKP